MKIAVTLLGALVLASCASPPKTPADSVAPSEQPTQVVEEKKEVKELSQSFEADLITSVAVERVFELRETEMIYLIDTRPALFFFRGHINQAVNIPLKKFDKAYAEKESEIAAARAAGKVLVVYCANEKCPDSYKMATRFAEKGISTSVFKGGWELWQQTGLE